MLFKNRRVFILSLAFCFSLFFIFFSFIHNYDYYPSSFHLTDKVLDTPYDFNYSTTQKNVIFPKTFPVKSSDLHAYYYANVNEEWNPVSSESPHIFKQHPFKIKPLTKAIMDSEFRPHPMKMYEGIKNLQGKKEVCDKQILKHLQLEISKDFELKSNIDGIVRVLLHQMRTDPAMGELKAFFKDSTLEKELEEGDAHKHWTKFAGTSVWLEEYKVHLMLSRMVYLPSADDKRSQSVSLTYAQLYDENWVELVDTTLVVPTNDFQEEDLDNPDLYNDKVKAKKKMNKMKENSDHLTFRNMKFPSFLSIPFYHNADYTHGHWYGPEDPRIIMIRNSAGYDEPLVTFNSYHRKVSKIEAENEDTTKLKYKFYRSMYITWPFQLQRGKKNIDGYEDPRYDSNLYMKTAELRRSGVERLGVQKNWTPFINTARRDAETGGDTSIYFVYRWKHLEILRCDIANLDKENMASCEFEYRQNKNLPANEKVGELRGGTQLLGLEDIIKESLARTEPDKARALLSLIPPNKQIWIGFARAHIGGCCGNAMYRPNLAVITREDGNYKVSQLSSYLSLDVSVFGWTRPEYKCEDKDANALIPNSITAWRIVNVLKDAEKAKVGHEYQNQVQFQDYLTLSISVSDETIQVLHIRNLLNTLLLNTAITKVIPPEDAKSSKEDQIVPVGYNNDVIDCAMHDSFLFCKSYANWVWEDEKEMKEKERKEKEAKEKEEKEKEEKKKAQQDKEEQEKADKEKAEKEAADKADKEKAEKQADEKLANELG